MSVKEATLEKLFEALYEKQPTYDKSVFKEGRVYRGQSVRRFLAPLIKFSRDWETAAIDFATKTASAMGNDESYHNGSSYNDTSQDILWCDLMKLPMDPIRNDIKEIVIKELEYRDAAEASKKFNERVDAEIAKLL